MIWASVFIWEEGVETESPLMFLCGLLSLQVQGLCIHTLGTMLGGKQEEEGQEIDGASALSCTMLAHLSQPV